jgi:hypothetical protein
MNLTTILKQLINEKRAILKTTIRETKTLASYKTDALTAKMWIDPNGKPHNLSEWHYRWFLKNASKYSIDVSGLPDDESTVRKFALQKGFFRVNFEHRNASLTIEGLKKNLSRKVKDAIFALVMDNLNDIDRVKLNLFEDDFQRVDSKYAEIFSYGTDDEKIEALDGILKEVVEGLPEK